MPCCCVKILNLCNVNICGVLEIELAATAADSPNANNYKLVLDYLWTQITITEEQTEGENIHFDVSALNENFEYTAQIFDSNGEKVTITEGEDTYDCIKFKTVMNVAV